jgi:hypothetical protein
MGGPNIKRDNSCTLHNNPCGYAISAKRAWAHKNFTQLPTHVHFILTPAVMLFQQKGRGLITIFNINFAIFLAFHRVECLHKFDIHFVHVSYLGICFTQFSRRICSCFTCSSEWNTNHYKTLLFFEWKLNEIINCIKNYMKPTCTKWFWEDP